MDKKRYAIILAGGMGVRVGGEKAKQFLEICGKPILQLTIENFSKVEPKLHLIVVVPKSYKEYWLEYCTNWDAKISHTIVEGGLTRFHSVKNALEFIEEESYVCVHDSVRPFADSDFISEIFDYLNQHKAVVPVISSPDSIREIKGKESFPVDRDKFVLVQTPQAFHSELLIKAYQQPFKPSFTDDASVVESIGEKIYLVEGKKLNFKITLPEDLLIANGLITSF